MRGPRKHFWADLRRSFVDNLVEEVCTYVIGLILLVLIALVYAHFVAK